MRILICNDDGIEAPGLARLVNAAAGLSDDVWVVAPDGKRTAAGSSLTIARPLTMRCTRPGWYSCSGTPADCVVSAMTWLFADAKAPDLVLSGVNDGRNVAEDIAYSGTPQKVASRAMPSVPAIGFSRVKNPDFSDADDEWLGGLIASLWQSRTDWTTEGHWLSVNLPTALPAEIRQPRIGRDKIGRKAEIVASEGDRTTITVPRGRDHASQPGDENEAIDAGFVSINRLNWFGETRLDERFLDRISAGGKAS